MKYTKEERLEIGRRIYSGEMTCFQAAELYCISDQTAKDYARLYRNKYQLPSKRGRKPTAPALSCQTIPAELAYLQSLTKEQLIQELLKTRFAQAE